MDVYWTDFVGVVLGILGVATFAFGAGAIASTDGSHDLGFWDGTIAALGFAGAFGGLAIIVGGAVVFIKGRDLI